MIIRYRILGEDNPLAPTETENEYGTYDEEASLRKFVELCREAIEDKFSEAEVFVDYEPIAGGVMSAEVTVECPDGLKYRPGDSGYYGRVANRVLEIANTVWGEYNWVVYETKAAREYEEDAVDEQN
jgi:hypothetical protein